MIRKLSILIVSILLPTLGIACAFGDAESSTPASPVAGRSPASTSAGPASPAALERGKALYKTHCTGCHGDTGKGDGPAAGVLKPPPRDHTDKAYMETLSDAEMARIIKLGGAIKGKPLMPSHPQFKDDDLGALVAFVRSLSTPVK